MMVKLLEQLGIERQRLRLEWVSAAEGQRFAELVKEITLEIKDLGPLNWGKAKEN